MTAISLLSKKEARAAKITLPVTRTEILTEATIDALDAERARFEANGIPAAIVLEKETQRAQHIALWRGKPPRPARTAHQFRRQSYASL